MQAPGWKTTEFWVTILVALANLLGVITQQVPPEYAGVATAVAAGLYAVSRGLAKVTLPPPSA